MKKILFYATSPNQIIGYGKIGNLISNYLSSLKDEVELIYFSVGNFQYSKVDNRKIDPNINFIDVVKIEQERGVDTNMGIDIIEEFYLKIKPDIFLIYYDLITTYCVLKKLEKYKDLKTTKFVSYIDLVCPFENINLVNYLDRMTDLIFVFTDFWKSNLCKIGINEKKICIFYHVVIDEYIKNICKKEARKYLNINEEDFVILNTNRNCYRKAIDITIRSFIKFFKK